MRGDKRVSHGWLRRSAAVFWRVLGSLLVVGSALWGVLALAYQAPGGVWGKGAAALLWTGLGLLVLVLLFELRTGVARRSLN